ncbi:MAG: hypothetical protein KGY78_03685 [Anaerolineae bacterium]|nr:hypothetical protein [Anaerolineae bacterium]
MPIRLRLNEREEKVMNALQGTGAMTPSQIAVETLMLPSETYDVLDKLEKDGYIHVLTTSGSADPSMVVLDGEIRSTLSKSSK